MTQMPVSIILNINKEDTSQVAEKGGRYKTRKNGEGGGGVMEEWDQGESEEIKEVKKQLDGSREVRGKQKGKQMTWFHQTGISAVDQNSQNVFQLTCVGKLVFELFKVKIQYTIVISIDLFLQAGISKSGRGVFQI